MRDTSSSKRRSGASKAQSGSVDVTQHELMTKRGKGRAVFPEVGGKVAKTIMGDSPVAGEHYRAVSPTVDRKPLKGTSQATKTN